MIDDWSPVSAPPDASSPNSSLSPSALRLQAHRASSGADKSKAPKVSVIIPLYNAEDYIGEAIESILAQSFTDFELIVIDDASTDRSFEIAQSVSDPRIRVMKNAVNMGPGFTQGVGVSQAEGKYIAILGADDVALPKRLARQVAYLDAHPEIAMVGSCYETMDSAGQVTGRVHVPCEPIAVRWRLLFWNPIAAPAVMVRREAIQHAGGFDHRIPYGEDMDLWGRIAAQGWIAQIDDFLTRYRVHERSVSHVMAVSRRRQWQREIYRKNVRRLGGIDVSLDVLGVLSGLADAASDALARQSYASLWAIANCFLTSIARNESERRTVFSLLLDDVLKVARHNDAQRLEGLILASRCALCHVPRMLLSRDFVRFSARIVAPTPIRRVFKRVARS